MGSRDVNFVETVFPFNVQYLEDQQQQPINN